MKEDKDVKSALDDIFGPDFIEIDVKTKKSDEDNNKEEKKLKEEQNSNEFSDALNEENNVLSNKTYVDDSKPLEKENVKNELNLIKKEQIDENILINNIKEEHKDIDLNIDKKESKKDNFNKKIIIYFVVGFILGLVLIYLIVNYVQNKTYVVNCSSKAEDVGYKYTDEYKITYKQDEILNVEGVYTYTALTDDYKPQVNIIKEDKSHAIINSNGMPGFTYTYEISDDYLKVNSYLDFTLFDYKKINKIDQDLMPISYFKISDDMTFSSLKKNLEKQGYKCVSTK